MLKLSVVAQRGLGGAAAGLEQQRIGCAFLSAAAASGGFRRLGRNAQHIVMRGESGALCRSAGERIIAGADAHGIRSSQVPQITAGIGTATGCAFGNHGGGNSAAASCNSFARIRLHQSSYAARPMPETPGLALLQLVLYGHERGVEGLVSNSPE